MKRTALALVFAAVVAAAGSAAAVDMMEVVEHKYVDSDGVKIHYAAAGSGPLVVFIHGFPDFWYSWNHQMAGLMDSHRVVALDTRGYNRSGQPPNQEDYDMTKLVADVVAVVKAEGQEKAVIAGHDWGGAIAWSLSFSMPQIVDKLIIVNLPHPKGLARELARNKEQRANSQYARNFQQPNSHESLNAQMLAGFASGSDAAKREKYIEAISRSSLNAMMNYYRQNYPHPPYEQNAAAIPKVNVPVLQFHGLEDRALHHHALNQTWEHLGKDYTLVTIPGVGHWSHHDAAELVTDTMKWWLAARE